MNYPATRTKSTALGKCYPIRGPTKQKDISIEKDRKKSYRVKLHFSVFDSRRAQLKCRLLTGTYTLQSNKAVFNQHLVDPTCQLCKGLQKTANTFLRSVLHMVKPGKSISLRLMKFPKDYLSMCHPQRCSRGLS